MRNQKGFGDTLRTRLRRMLKGRLRRWALVTSGTLFILVTAAGLAMGPLVRSRVTAAAERRHATVRVGKVRAGWFVVRLENVHTTLSDVPEIALENCRVEVELSALLAPRQVTFRGGTLHVSGEPETLRGRLAGQESQAAAREQKDSPTLRLAETALEWTDFDGLGASVRASAFGAARDGSVLRIDAAEVLAESAAGTVVVRGVHARLGGGLLQSLEAKDASVMLRTEKTSESAAASAPESSHSEAALEDAPVPAAAPDKKTTKAGPRAPSPQSTPIELPLPDLRVARHLADSLGKRIAARMSEDASVSIENVALVLRKRAANSALAQTANVHNTPDGPQEFSIGRGPFTLTRTATTLATTFASQSEAGGAPLQLRVALPLDAAGDLRVHLEGGPVPAALLGLREGALGLTDIAKASIAGNGDVALASAGESLTFDGRLACTGLGLLQPRLSRETLHGLDAALVARGLLTRDGQLRLDDGEVSVGAFHLRAHGTARRGPANLISDVAFEVPTASCEKLKASLPSAIVPTLDGATMTGTFGARGRLAFDSAHLDDLVLDYSIQDACRLQAVPEHLARDRFSKAFRHRVYHPDGTAGEETIGPGTDAWTDLNRISPFMEAAVLTTEDGAFRHHRGFSHVAFKRALVNNLKVGRFVQGASTISMQLAKNLFLTREKTLSRKLEELILTDYLEQTFSKDEMMELYLNVIEFGPDVYGITKAARYYFGRAAEELNLSESMFLATLLPSPVKLSHLKDRGELSPGWQTHIDALVRIANKNGKITEGEFAEGHGQKVVFMHNDGARTPPVRRRTATVREGTDDDWTPVEAPR
jgi:Transglycosylase